MSLRIENIMSPLRMVEAFSISSSSAMDRRSAGLLALRSDRFRRSAIIEGFMIARRSG
jgi:hypothetical protein